MLESLVGFGGFFGEEFSFHLSKSERKRLKYALLTGSFSSLGAALRMLSESLKTLFLEEVKIHNHNCFASKVTNVTETVFDTFYFN